MFPPASAPPVTGQPPNQGIPPSPLDDIPDVTEGEGTPVEANKPLSEEVKKALFQILRDAREEDKQVRWEYFRVWKRLEYYWNNILDIFYDNNTKDWRVPNWEEMEDEIPPRLINIYRPHGEAIVAALSVAIPGVVYHPDDADSPDDLEAAKAYRAITELLALHNDAPMLFIRALVILFNQGTIFGYNYYHTDPKFGTIERPKIQNVDVSTFNATCPTCGEPLDAGAAGNHQPSYNCSECGNVGPASINEGVESLPQIVGFDKTSKGSVCQDIWSGLNVKVPAYATKQEDCGYLLLEFAQSVGMLRYIFKDVTKESGKKIESKQYDPAWETFSKLPIQYLGQVPDSTANVSCIWVRPYHYYNLDDDTIVAELEQSFPDGCYAIFVNDEFMEAYPEKMDEHWTISKNPLGQFIYGRPLGENLATVQDIRAQLVEIELQTAEYGIPETFVDGRVLDFQKYGEGRAKPGMMTQVKAAPGGKGIGEAFFTTKSAVLSQEIDPLRQHIDQDAQFVSGSFPSIYGGISQGGSKTAAEYSQSKAMALQRIGTVWKIVCNFWSSFQSRSSVEYAENLKEQGRDEKFTKKNGQSFVNVWIRSTSLSGKVGRVEPEASEQLPVSWSQKKDSLMMLVQAGIPEILQVLLHPNNAELMKEAIGIRDLYIPGEEDRIRQLKEFVVLSQGIPLPTNPMVDNDEVHIEVLQSILEGEQGDSLDDAAKQACMQHLQEHMMAMAQKAANSAPQDGSNPDKGNGTPPKGQKPGSTAPASASGGL